MERRWLLGAEIVNFERRRKAWLKRLATDILQTQEAMPLDFVPGDNNPAWVERIEEEIGRAMLPVAKLREGVELTPKRLGALLGHQCAYAVFLKDAFLEESAILEDTATPNSQTTEEITQAEPFSVSFAKWYEAMRRLAKRGLRSCVDQTYEDMNDFLMGYSSAFARKPKTLAPGDVGSSAFEVYIFLILFREHVQHMNSVSELHEALRRALGNQKTGDLKRVEKICQRIGLNFRKPGRPPKQK